MNAALSARLTGGVGIEAVVPLLLFGMWQLHYFHRAFIYPFQIEVRPGSGTTVAPAR